MLGAGAGAAFTPLAARRVPSRLGLMLALVLAAVIGLLAPVARAQPITDEEKKAIIERTESVIERRAFAAGVDFKRWPTVLAKYQSQLDEAKTVPGFTRALNQALNEFGISHLDVLTPRAAADRQRNALAGVGIRYNGRGSWEDGIEIGEVMDGGPSDRAGIRSGDWILKIDGEAITDPNKLRGEEGSTVRLTIRRAEGGKVEDVTVTRGKINIATLRELDGGAMLLRVPTFDAGNYDRELVEQLFRRASGAPYLVLDLRSNGGGAVSNLQHLLGMFFERGTVVGFQVSKDLTDRYAKETGNDPADLAAVAEWGREKGIVSRMRAAGRRDGELKPYSGKVAVLINGASASASEIVAAALSELRSAPLVGTRTAGAVLVSTYQRLESGFQMKVPVSDYVTVKGRRLEGKPLVADVRAGGWPRGGAAQQPANDEAVQLAIERLKRED